MARGTKGKLGPFLQDFTGSFEDVTWAATSVDLGEGWYMVSVNEGTLNKVVDEPGGVLQFLTAAGDNDNVALICGPFSPGDGGCEMEARFKVADDLNFAIFAGFSETMAQDTPVMPAEFATATMTYNGTGGMAGFNYDVDGTTDDFRAVVADGSAAVTAADANGTRANQTITADEYYVVRVEIDNAGQASMWISHDTDSMEKVAGPIVGLTPGDLFYAVLMCENRAAAAHEFEVDYVMAQGFRDWTV